MFDIDLILKKAVENKKMHIEDIDAFSNETYIDLRPLLKDLGFIVDPLTCDYVLK